MSGKIENRTHGSFTEYKWLMQPRTNQFKGYAVPLRAKQSTSRHRHQVDLNVNDQQPPTSQIRAGCHFFCVLSTAAVSAVLICKC